MGYEKYYQDGWKSGETGGTPITPEALNHMEQGIQDAAPMEYAKKVGAPYNLLDNSDFTNLVNQRGATPSTLTNGTYFWDRWRYNSGALTWDENGAVFGTDTTIQQRIPYRADLVGAEVTFVWYFADGAKEVKNTTLNASGTDFLYKTISPPTKNKSVKHVALYVGTYTAENAPEYQPKGYATELLECQRYFYSMRTNWAVYPGYKSSGYLCFDIYLPMPMRIKPTFSAERMYCRGTLANENSEREVSLDNIVYSLDNLVRIEVTETGTAFSNHQVIIGTFYTATLSADL